MGEDEAADLHVLGDAYNQPGKRPVLLCQQCLGRYAGPALHESGPGLDGPIIIVVAVAPDRRVRPLDNALAYLREATLSRSPASRGR